MMRPMQELRVHLLPELVEPADLAGRTVVVIDVLRATTTICHALAAGATDVVPCLEIDDARQKAREVGPSAVLGGERRGVRIDGFDLGNSPTEYTPASVGGRTVVFTTTNGTKAMLRAREAANILLGAFVNLSAIVEAICEHDRVDLLCAGTFGRVTAEDALFAGAVVERVGMMDELNDQARLVLDAWRMTVVSETPLAAVLRECQGGRNLIAEGFDADIDTAAKIDALQIVPRYDVAAGRITA